MIIHKGKWYRHPDFSANVEVISVTLHSLQFGGCDVAEVWPVGVHATPDDAVTVLISELTPIEWDESAMRELAANWISPSPLDRELTRFATGHDRNPGSVVDWNEFISECEYNQRHYAGDYDAYHELTTLIVYARERMEGN
jgi:hypothetical protein